MNTVQAPQEHHDTLPEREEAAAHPAPFDVIWDFIQVGAMCALATGVFAFVVGVLVAQMKNHC